MAGPHGSRITGQTLQTAKVAKDTKTYEAEHMKQDMKNEAKRDRTQAEQERR